LVTRLEKWIRNKFLSARRSRHAHVRIIIGAPSAAMYFIVPGEITARTWKAFFLLIRAMRVSLAASL
jgi:hypothetical protein